MLIYVFNISSLCIVGICILLLVMGGLREGGEGENGPAGACRAAAEVPTTQRS